jgi:hypothetical protein
MYQTSIIKRIQIKMSKVIEWVSDLIGEYREYLENGGSDNFTHEDGQSIIFNYYPYSKTWNRPLSNKEKEKMKRLRTSYYNKVHPMQTTN